MQFYFGECGYKEGEVLGAPGMNWEGFWGGWGGSALLGPCPACAPRHGAVGAAPGPPPAEEGHRAPGGLHPPQLLPWRGTLGCDLGQETPRGPLRHPRVSQSTPPLKFWCVPPAAMFPQTTRVVPPCPLLITFPPMSLMSL